MTPVTEDLTHEPQFRSMEIAGYAASLFIGVSLGLIGGGGSILTLPVLVYLFAVSPTTAISYSLFIVGATSLAGAINNYRKGWVNMRTALLFGAASITTVFGIRRFVVLILPDVFFTIHTFQVTRALFLMVVFAMLMIFASLTMIRGKKTEPSAVAGFSFWKLLLYGVGVGLVTGFLGAGGGFLMIPALVILLKLSMKEAIGTSLLIIAFNSLIGFAVDLGQYKMDWSLLVTVSLVAIGGIFIGGYLNQKIDGTQLKKGFGWFVLIMGVYIILQEIVFSKTSL